jgi:hypothetical protein
MRLVAAGAVDSVDDGISMVDLTALWHSPYEDNDGGVVSSSGLVSRLVPWEPLFFRLEILLAPAFWVRRGYCDVVLRLRDVLTGPG